MLTLVGFFLDGDDASCRTGLTFSIPKTKSSMPGDEPILIAFLILAVSTEVLLIGKFIDGLMISSLSGFLTDGVTDVFPLLFFLSAGLFDEISSPCVSVSAYCRRHHISYRDSWFCRLDHTSYGETFCQSRTKKNNDVEPCNRCDPNFDIRYRNPYYSNNRRNKTWRPHFSFRYTVFLIFD